MKRIIFFGTACLLFCNMSLGQRLISGTVSTEDGGEVPGVNVMLEGTNTGTITDLDGEYIECSRRRGNTSIYFHRSPDAGGDHRLAIHNRCYFG